MSALLLGLQNLLQQTNCVIEMTCFPDFQNPLSVWTFYKEFYGIPNAVTLGIILGIISAGIVVWQRSLASLAICGIYITSIVSSTWLNDTYIAPQYHVITYLIVVAIASLLVMAVLKTIRE
jgi:hypothetical protein